MAFLQYQQVSLHYFMLLLPPRDPGVERSVASGADQGKKCQENIQPLTFAIICNIVEYLYICNIVTKNTMSRILFFVIAGLSVLTSGALAQENQVSARSNVAKGTNKTQQKFDFTGTVTDQKTNAPLAGATIYIPDLHTGAIADENGHFTITSISAGKYIIEISYQGYASIIESITINGNLQVNFALSATIVEQQGVTVTGVTFATRTKQNPQVVNILKYDDLLGISSTNIMDALAKAVPGVSIVSTGPAVSKPFIRGLGYNRVVVVNDGVRQEGQQWGDEHGIEIDDYSAQRVEVLKGPSSLMYGSDAIAGVINIQTQTPDRVGPASPSVPARPAHRQRDGQSSPPPPATHRWPAARGQPSSVFPAVRWHCHSSTLWPLAPESSKPAC